MIRNKVKKLFFKEGGSVSIFSMVLILPIFMISALFIDSLRIMTASRELDEAMDAALRSTMSNYNKTLSDVGIFTNSQESAPNGIFNDYLNQQIAYSDESFTNFSQLEITSGEANFDNSRNITTTQVFDHQIAESMKYTAPVQFLSSGADFLDSLKGENLEKIKNTVDTAGDYEELYQLIKKRNDKIQELINGNKFLELKSKVIQSYKSKIIGETVSKEDKIPNFTKLRHISKFDMYIDRYNQLKKEKMALEEAEDDEGLKKFEDDGKNKELSNFITGAEGLSASILANVETVESDMEKYETEIIEGLFGKDGTYENPKKNSAMDYQNQINEMIKTSNFEDLQFTNMDNSFFKEIEDNLIDMKIKVRGDVVTDSKGATMLTGKFRWYIAQMSSGLIFDSVTGLDIFVSDLKEVYKEMGKQVKEIDTHYKNINTEVGKFKTHLDSIKTSDGKSIDEAEEAKEDAEKNLLEQIQEINTISEQMIHEAGIYSEVQGYYSSYGGSDNGVGLFELGNPVETAEDFIKYIEDMYNFATGIPGSVTNHVYINEFIFQKYAISEPYSLMDLESFSYDTKEGLYILYGNAVPGANYVNFLLQIFFIVFIFELVENFKVAMTPPTPWNFLVWITNSLVEAAFVFDELLTNQDPNPSTNLSIAGKEVNIRFTDWYRLFLYTMFDKESKDLRTLAVLSEEYNIDFNEKGETYLTANVEAEVDILFIPAFFAITGDLNRDKYVLKKERHFSY